ncbi:hypothetical protein V1264_018995 [Littorina saxatilis]|uniref:Mutator-like transposase domain-containing protein n=1 Tax=Littorina saxatilis TaxID=31220 RepID=A0AAN9BFN0_9CAEN
MTVPVTSVPISCDGSWMTRGHSSTVGATTIIGLETGKVLDTEVKSKKCKSCQCWATRDKNSERYQQWEADHPMECTKNHEGSSGSTESASDRDMFLRSVQHHDLRYTKFIGDGDTNSFKTVFDSKPYGEEKLVEKLECVGHVQKRMGNRLRSLKKRNKGQVLSDGKPIGGQRRLTDAVCDKLQTYYGNAIRGNKGDLVEMRKAVWAVFFHKGSTDTKLAYTPLLQCPVVPLPTGTEGWQA